MPFDTIPPNAELCPHKFTAHASDQQLEDFKTLLKLSKIGPKTYENRVADPKDFTGFGITREWLASAKRTWETAYDWRKTEDRINALPNFGVEVEHDGFKCNVHFAALFSKKADAVPLLLLHGWPGSFLEFVGVLEELGVKYEEHTLPFHVIVPSIPGYGFSGGPPLNRNFTIF